MGEFREDLWFRLSVFPIQIPPLRERKVDIPALVNHFLQKKKNELNLGIDVDLMPGSMDNLLAYDWPGNVRELINVVERALIQHDNGVVSFNLRGWPIRPAQSLPPTPVWPNAGYGDREEDFYELDEVMRIHIQKALKICRGKISGPGGAAELLNVVPNTLRKRMDKLGIEFRRKAMDRSYPRGSVGTRNG